MILRFGIKFSLIRTADIAPESAPAGLRAKTAKLVSSSSLSFLATLNREQNNCNKDLLYHSICYGFYTGICPNLSNYWFQYFGACGPRSKYRLLGNGAALVPDPNSTEGRKEYLNLAIDFSRTFILPETKQAKPLRFLQNMNP